MKNKRSKIIIPLLWISFIALITVFVGDNLLSEAENSSSGSIEICKEGISVPAAVRNIEMHLSHADETEMLKHYDVKGKDKNNNIYGYVQIWKSKQSLAHYLKISKEYMSANVFGLREGKITINGIVWQKWEYIVNDIWVSQGFYEKDNKIYLCSLCVPYQEKTYAFDAIFVELLEDVIDK